MNLKSIAAAVLINLILLPNLFAESTYSCSTDTKGKAVVIDSANPGKPVAVAKIKNKLAKTKEKLKSQKSAIKSSKKLSKDAKAAKLAELKIKEDANKADSAIIKTCKDGAPTPILGENQVAGTIVVEEQLYTDPKTSIERCMLVTFVRFPDNAGVIYNQVEYLEAGEKVATPISPPYTDSYVTDSSFFNVAIRFDAPAGQHQHRIKSSGDFPPCSEGKAIFLKTYKNAVLTKQ